MKDPRLFDFAENILTILDFLIIMAGIIFATVDAFAGAYVYHVVGSGVTGEIADLHKNGSVAGLVLVGNQTVCVEGTWTGKGMATVGDGINKYEVEVVNGINN